MMLKVHLFSTFFSLLAISFLGVFEGVTNVNYGDWIIIYSSIIVPNVLIDVFGHSDFHRNRVMHGLFPSIVINSSLAYILYIALGASHLFLSVGLYIFTALHHLILDSFSMQGIYVFGRWRSLSDKPYDYPLYNALAILTPLIAGGFILVYRMGLEKTWSGILTALALFLMFLLLWAFGGKSKK
jgi:hypothetical protein